MTSSPWTEAQDQSLRDHYVKGGTKAVSKLTGKTAAAIHQRSRRIGCPRFRRWTEKEDEHLRMDWGSTAFSEICRTMGRTKQGVYYRAQELGLTGHAPQGYEFLTQAAIRTGFDWKSLRVILAASGFKVRPVTTRPVKGRGDRRHWLVDVTEVDDAVEAWLATETPCGAARRIGISADTLLKWLKAAGSVRPKEKARGTPWRVPTAEIDRVVALHLEDPSENIVQAGRRLGLTYECLGKWLRDAGVDLSKKPVKLDPAMVDRVVVERRKRNTCRNKGPGWVPKRVRKAKRRKA